MRPVALVSLDESDADLRLASVRPYISISVSASLPRAPFRRYISADGSRGTNSAKRHSKLTKCAVHCEASESTSGERLATFNKVVSLPEDRVYEVRVSWLDDDNI